ncbi:MAG: hypothetical protein D6732_29190 [Methanobacteriota archaeon]|nr:MAG: hypothetical protein D6732_29190 [Euryarchaeota archaeon]
MLVRKLNNFEKTSKSGENEIVIYRILVLSFHQNLDFSPHPLKFSLIFELKGAFLFTEKRYL